jgi:hypothetical protein
MSSDRHSTHLNRLGSDQRISLSPSGSPTRRIQYNHVSPYFCLETGADVTSQAMMSLQESTAAKSLVFGKDVLEVGTSDPSATAVHGQSFSHGLRCTARYTVENFERIYRPAKSSSSPGATSDPPVTPTIPAGVTEDDIKDVLRLQSEIDIHLGLSIYRIGTMIGQKVQVDIHAMLDQVESKLRTAFQLDQVEESVRKRSRGLFETSGDRIKRAKLMEKERSLSEVE